MQGDAQRRGVTEQHQNSTTTIGSNPEPILLSAAQAAQLLGVGRTLWYQLVATGRAPAPLHLGGRVLWRTRELRAWIEAGAPPRARWHWPERSR